MGVLQRSKSMLSKNGLYSKVIMSYFAVSALKLLSISLNLITLAIGLSKIEKQKDSREIFYNHVE